MPRLTTDVHYARVCAAIASARGASPELEGVDTETREPIDYEDYWWMDWHGWGVDDYRTTHYLRVTDILRRIQANQRCFHVEPSDAPPS